MSEKFKMQKIQSANLEVSRLYRKNPSLLVEKVIFYKLVVFDSR